MKLTGRGGGLRTILVVVLCALFFLMAMGITLLGSGIYRDTVATSDQNFTCRTALSYLVNQVRRGDLADGVTVGSFGESDAILLHEAGYVTILYCYEGQLRELYMEEGLDLLPADGLAVMPLAGLELDADAAGWLTMTVAGADGARYATTLAPRSGFGGEVAV